MSRIMQPDPIKDIEEKDHPMVALLAWPVFLSPRESFRCFSAILSVRGGALKRYDTAEYQKSQRPANVERYYLVFKPHRACPRFPFKARITKDTLYHTCYTRILYVNINIKISQFCVHAFVLY